MISKLTDFFARTNKTSLSTLTIVISLFVVTLIADISVASERLYNGGSSMSVTSVARRLIHTDFNNDGNMDMIVHTVPTWLVVYLGNGDGTFEYGDNLNMGNAEGSAFTVGDVNDDGFVDVIQGTQGGSNTGWVNIVINDQAGGFGNHYRVSTPGLVIGVEVVDFDNQHGLDIAYSMVGTNGVGVILSTGLGDSLTEASIITAPLPYPSLYASSGITAIQDGLSAADVDGVNGIDLISMATTSSTGYAVIWHNNGNGTFSPTPDTITLAGKSIIVIPEDYDQDGYVDLLATDFSGRASIHLNDNYNGFLPLINISSDLNFQSIRELHVVDINFDTYPDIIFPTIESLSGDYRTDVYYNDGTGRFGDQATFYAGGQWIALEDLNNDGLYDITGVTTNANTVLISLGDAPGSFLKPGVPVKGEAVALATGDINNDGRIDIVSSHNRKYYTYLQNLDGTFSGTLIFPSDIYRVNEIELVDLNNDNNLDLVGLATGRRFVNLGNGDGTFGPIAAYNTQSSINVNKYLFLDDFTDDGYVDLISKTSSSLTSLSLYVNNQDGSFTRSDFTLDYWQITFGDINNDSKPDLIKTLGDSVFISYNDGTGNFPNHDLKLDGRAFVYSVDWNDDNYLDILTMGLAPDYDATIYLNNNDSTFTPIILDGAPVNSTPLAVSDLDSDGDYDFLSSSLGSFNAVMNDGTNTFTWDRYIMFRNLQSSTAADLNNDGLLDVVMGYGVPNVNSNFSKELMFIAYNNGNGLDTCLSPFDYDADGYKDDCDNCPTISNPGQADGNLDGIGDLCSFNGNTPVGAPVVVNLGDVTVTFTEVTTGGSTDLTLTPNGPFAPEDVILLPITPNNYYNISTTAVYNGDITVCINYDDKDLSALQENRLSLNHFNLAIWDNATSIVDTVNNTICGITKSLSPFAIGIAKVPTDVEEIINGLLPTSIELSDNYPNPFNPSTTIEFSIPSKSFVSLKIYNLLGQEVITLVDENMSAGTYRTTWDSNNNAGNQVGSGVYFYKLTVGAEVISKKMMLLK